MDDALISQHIRNGNSELALKASDGNQSIKEKYIDRISNDDIQNEILALQFEEDFKMSSCQKQIEDILNKFGKTRFNSALSNIVL